MIGTHALNDIDAALSEKLAGVDATDSLAIRRVLDELFRDDRFVHLLTACIHESIGSPFDRGEIGQASCGDYAEKLVQKLIWRF